MVRPRVPLSDLLVVWMRPALVTGSGLQWFESPTLCRTEDLPQAVPDSPLETSTRMTPGNMWLGHIVYSGRWGEVFSCNRVSWGHPGMPFYLFDLSNKVCGTYSAYRDMCQQKHYHAMIYTGNQSYCPTLAMAWNSGSWPGAWSLSPCIPASVLSPHRVGPLPGW